MGGTAGGRGGGGGVGSVVWLGKMEGGPEWRRFLVRLERLEREVGGEGGVRGLAEMFRFGRREIWLIW